MLTLTVLIGPDTGTKFEIADDIVTIGRNLSCNVMLHDSRVGSRHCEIRREGNRFILCDLKSRNGTYVNNSTKRIDTYVLRHCDQVRLGKSLIEVSLPEGSRIEPLPPDPQEPAGVSVLNVGDTSRIEQLAPAGALPITSPPSTNTPQVTLRILDGPDTGRVFTLPANISRFVVGRSSTADFTLTDQSVSRTHFAIEITQHCVILTDEASLNGTFINNERVNRYELRGGEKIRVCETHIQVDIEGVTATKSPDTTPSPTRERSVNTPSTSSAITFPPPVESPTPTVHILSDASKPLSLAHRPARKTFFAVFIVVVTIASTVAWLKPLWFARGPLSSSHAPWEEECATCHATWGRRSVNTTCGETDCHAKVLRAQPHIQDQCTQCHNEHRGRTFAIRGTREQCWQCHANSFQNRAVAQHYRERFLGVAIRGEQSELQWKLPSSTEDQSEWLRHFPHEETGLRFGHLIHANKSGVERCLVCHEPLPGEIINALGSGSAFPSHDECIDCHAEVGNRNPRVAIQSPSAACKKCHTRDNYGVTREQRPFIYVQFSHNDHLTSPCQSCHVTIANQRNYRPGIRSRLYPLPMEACVSCHNKLNVRTTCVSCHQSHHRYIPQGHETNGLRTAPSLPVALLCLVGLSFCVSLYLSRR